MNKSIISSFLHLMKDEPRRKWKTGLGLGVTCGLLEGLVFFTLIPIQGSLYSGETAWGLGFSSWLLVLGALALAYAVLNFYGTKIGYLGALDFMGDTQLMVGDKVASLPLPYFDNESAGTLSRMVTSEIMGLQEIAGQLIYNTVRGICAGLVLLVLSLFWQVQVGLFLLVAIPLVALLVWLGKGMVARGRKFIEPSENELAERIVEFYTCQGALRTSGLGGTYPPLDQALKEAEEAGKANLVYGTLGSFMGGVAAQFIICGVIILTGRLILGGSLAPLEAVILIGIILRFQTIFTDIINGFNSIEDRRPLIQQIEDLLAEEVLEEPETSKNLTSPGSVALESVDFSYREGLPVLRALSFEVQPRTMTAIVGPSGSGKTTIFRLISRFYDPDSGSVKVGGVDNRDLKLEDLMAQVSMVFQEVYLFDDSLMENIRVARPGASDEEVQEVMDLSGVSEIVARLPQGALTPVGEGGSRLSGGERQRVSVARALLKQSPIVLFDEATSALDPENEDHLVQTMVKLKDQASLLVIAHKLETIQGADEIIVLSQDGQVSERGSHQDLLKNKSDYKIFWDRRKEASGWSLL